MFRGPRSGSKSTLRIRRQLRKNLTEPEKILWSKLSRKSFSGIKFRRQHGIDNYVVDFYCPDKKLIIEVDGDSHTEVESLRKDKVRTKYLASLGYKIVRYNNRDVLYNIEGVLEDLDTKLKSITPSNSPSRGGE